MPLDTANCIYARLSSKLIDDSIMTRQTNVETTSRLQDFKLSLKFSHHDLVLSVFNCLYVCAWYARKDAMAPDARAASTMSPIWRIVHVVK